MWWRDAAITSADLERHPGEQTSRRDADESAELAADRQKLLPALGADLGAVQAAQFGEGLGDGIAGRGDHLGGIAMRAAERLRQ